MFDVVRFQSDQAVLLRALACTRLGEGHFSSVVKTNLEEFREGMNMD
jgi:hypothetical protein